MSENGSLRKCDVRHKALMVFVGRNWDGLGRDKLYEAANYAWGVNPERVKSAEIVLAIYKRCVAGVFVPRMWLEANFKNYPSKSNSKHSNRYGFVGEEASFEIQQFYVGRRLDEDLKGTGGGFRYVHC